MQSENFIESFRKLKKLLKIKDFSKTEMNIIGFSNTQDFALKTAIMNEIAKVLSCDLVPIQLFGPLYPSSIRPNGEKILPLTQAN